MAGPDHLTLDVEKPAAGGRMLARHHGQIVLVWGAIPGERVVARIERTGKGVVFAETVEVLTPSSDRRAFPGDWRCGGQALAHVRYARQVQLKGEIIRDALSRIGRLPLAEAPEVIGSSEQGYRMRARLHARDGRLGFYREGTHDLCDAVATGQLSSETNDWIPRAADLIRRDRLTGLVGMELAESVDGDQRAVHLELRAGSDTAPFAVLADGLVGLSAQAADRPAVTIVAGVPELTDGLLVREGDAPAALRLTRDVRAFFQGNRFLLEPLVRRVVALVPTGPVVDLYAGVGLFGLGLLVAGAERVTLVEGDPIAGRNLQDNARVFGDRAVVHRRGVEAFLGPSTDRARSLADATVVLDPPRTGLSSLALAGLIGARPSRIVYVSCDVATLARDTRGLVNADYALESIVGLDLFPNTAHVETVASFARR